MLRPPEIIAMPLSPARATPTMARMVVPTRAALGLVLAALLCLAACGDRTVVVYQPAPAPQTTTVQPAPAATYYQPPPPPPPQQQQTVVIEQQWNDEETNTVIYREYYGCSEDEIYVMPHYRRYYQVDNDDLFFVCFMARHAHVSFDVAFNQWYFGCGRDCNRMVLYYHVDPGVFFVYAPPGYAYPAIYARPYACYHNQQLAGASFSNGEYHALISLRIGVEYQGCTTDVFFRNTATYGSPSRVVYYNRERCGMGGHGCAGMSIRVGVRPWTLSARDHAAWRQENANRREAHEAPFREQHREELVRVQHGEGGARPPGEPERHLGDQPRHDDHWVPRQPGDHPPGSDQRQPGDRPSGSDQRQPSDRPSGSDQRQPGDRPSGGDQRQPGPRQPNDRPGSGDPAHGPAGGQRPPDHSDQHGQENRKSEGQGGKEKDSK
jgi:hypothetical protein